MFECASVFVMRVILICVCVCVCTVHMFIHVTSISTEKRLHKFSEQVSRWFMFLGLPFMQDRPLDVDVCLGFMMCLMYVDPRQTFR